MPKNVTNFTRENEGKNAFCIEYEPSFNTLVEYENRDFLQKMTWNVVGVSPTFIDF